MELRMREVDKGGNSEVYKSKTGVPSTGSAGLPLASSVTVRGSKSTVVINRFLVFVNIVIILFQISFAISTFFIFQ